MGGKTRLVVSGSIATPLAGGLMIFLNAYGSKTHRCCLMMSAVKTLPTRATLNKMVVIELGTTTFHALSVSRSFVTHPTKSSC